MADIADSGATANVGCFARLFGKRAKGKVLPQDSPPEKKSSSHTTSAKPRSQPAEHRSYNSDNSAVQSAKNEKNAFEPQNGGENDAYADQINMLVASYSRPMGNRNEKDKPASGASSGRLAPIESGAGSNLSIPGQNRSMNELPGAVPSNPEEEEAVILKANQSASSKNLVGNRVRESSRLTSQKSTRDRRGSFLVSEFQKPQSVRTSVFEQGAMMQALSNMNGANGQGGTQDAKGGEDKEGGSTVRKSKMDLATGPAAIYANSTRAGPRKLDI